MPPMNHTLPRILCTLATPIGRHAQNHILVRAFVLLVLVQLTACGELSWKRGAREQDWNADRAACAGEARFNTCMEARGWYVRRLDADDGGKDGAGATAGLLFDPDAALSGDGGGGAGTGEGAGGPASPGVEAASADPARTHLAGSGSALRQAMPSAATLARVGEGASPRLRDPATSGARAGDGTPPSAARVKAEDTVRPDAGNTSEPGSVAAPVAEPSQQASGARSPLDRVEVRGWWKPGGRGEEVDAEIARCAARLGPAHAPQAGRYTLGLLSCLKESGWRALKVGEFTR